MPGVSTSRPPPGSTCSSRAVVACRPRPSPSRTSRVPATVRPASALARLDLPTPEGPTMAAVRPGPTTARTGVASRAGDRADREHLDAEGVLSDLRDGGGDVVAQVGLGQDDDRRRAAAPRHGEV